ncbi:MAG: DNA-3-methyladenine glycosylase family protein [Candidatus Saccharibacteria bacterium]
MSDMHLITSDTKITAMQYLSDHDPRLASAITRAGLCSIKPHHDYYRALGDSIIGQQLSVKAAATIKQRFRDLFGGEFPSPEAILQKSIEELRTAGLSASKAGYIQDLAQHILDGRIDFSDIDSLSNQEIITKLTDVKGIGEWTVHMFLMFCVGRSDVLATGDLGVRNGIQALYSLEKLPTPQQVTDIAVANHWHPFESFACWYVWHSLDNKPA